MRLRYAGRALPRPITTLIFLLTHALLHYGIVPGMPGTDHPNNFVRHEAKPPPNSLPPDIRAELQRLIEQSGSGVLQMGQAFWSNEQESLYEVSELRAEGGQFMVSVDLIPEGAGTSPYTPPKASDDTCRRAKPL
mmetsp:Transcript_51082/g.125471  ORF Transcript_51082/g.125471 Transcript_51082/m.125471 type:complete len:135 (-) Transcript_51082:55-459(-)